MNGGWLIERDELARRIADGQPAPQGEPTELHLGQVAIIDEVFQHRSGNQAASRAHVDELTKALERNQGRALDPITVFWAGDGWCCVDGHHRVEAYRQANHDKPIPVRAFKGSLDEAIAEAARGNSKDKLPMGRAEKSQAAWRLVISTNLSKQRLARAAAVSEGTIANMRRVAKKIKEERPEVTLDELNWWGADRIAKGLEPRQVDYDDGWLAKQAQKVADRLCKHFGDRLGKQPEVTARALEIYSQRLADALAEHWNVSAGVDDIDDNDEF